MEQNGRFVNAAWLRRLAAARLPQLVQQTPYPSTALQPHSDPRASSHFCLRLHVTLITHDWEN